MKSRTEQQHEQYPDFALILPRRAAFALRLEESLRTGACDHIS
jgi:hypothetical protein